jgi:hypothetical protein
MTTYTIEQIKESHYTLPQDFINYLYEEAPKISAMFDNKLDYRNCPVRKLVNDCIFLVCRRDGEIRGHMICNLFTSPLDSKVKILYQLSFYVKPDSGRTAYHLFQKFIDIGKDRANHIITMLTSHTNIKPSTLENMGFKELETLYRMEIK